MVIRTVILVLGAEGQLQVIVGGEVGASEGMQVCRAAADFFQGQAVEAEVARRVEEMRKDGDRPATDKRRLGKSQPPVVNG